MNTETHEEQDTREKLEADVREWWNPSDNPNVDTNLEYAQALEWLDRQAAITTRECCETDELCCESCRAAQKREVIELKRERDELREHVDDLNGANELLDNLNDELRAKVDELKENRRKQADTIRTLSTENDRERDEQRRLKAIAEQKLNALVNRLKEHHVGLYWNDSYSDWTVNLPIIGQDGKHGNCAECRAKLEAEYMPLPLDADGVPIKLGDTVEFGENSNQGAVKAVGDSMVIVLHTDCNYTNYAKYGILWSADACRHVKPKPTVEELLEVFIAAYDNWDDSDFTAKRMENREKLFAEYADRIREACDDR